MPSSSSTIALTNAIIFTGDAFIEGHALLLSNGKVLDLVSNAQIPADSKEYSCANHIIAPGFIDCQVNGGANILFNNSPSADRLLQIVKAHRKTGTTSLLPTCITDTRDTLNKAITAMREAKAQESSILGIHIEGPHINKSKKGMHEASHIRPLTEEDLVLYQPKADERFLITLAPEVVPPTDISKLIANGLIVSLGHSAATTEQTLNALDAGASCFTHLFNAMPPLASRDGGIASVALTHPASYCGIILDGHHVSREMVQMACAAKPHDKLFMVSDAIAPAGAEDPQPFTYNGVKYLPEDGVCKNEDGTLGGALRTLGECVSVAIKELRLDPVRVLKMASTIPAEFLGLDDHLGKLLPDYTADIVVLDHSFKTTLVWKDGKQV